MRCFLIFANKQDFPGALAAADISEAMGLSSIKDHSWFICKTCATKGKDYMKDWIGWLNNLNKDEYNFVFKGTNEFIWSYRGHGV